MLLYLFLLALAFNSHFVCLCFVFLLRTRRLVKQSPTLLIWRSLRSAIFTVFHQFVTVCHCFPLFFHCFSLFFRWHQEEVQGEIGKLQEVVDRALQSQTSRGDGGL